MCLSQPFTFDFYFSGAIPTTGLVLSSLGHLPWPHLEGDNCCSGSLCSQSGLHASHMSLAQPGLATNSIKTFYLLIWVKIILICLEANHREQE